MSLFNDIAQGTWMMSFDALASYSRIASKIVNGESFNFVKNTKSLLSVYDNNGKIVQPEQNGNINAPKNSVAVIKIEGVLIKESDYCTQGTVDIVKELESYSRWTRSVNFKNAFNKITFILYAKIGEINTNGVYIRK